MKTQLLYLILFTSLFINAQTQIGQNIDGTGAGDFSGNSISLSADGTTVAIGESRSNNNGIDSGSAKIFKNIGGTWSQVGSTINGAAATNLFGSSISISANGTTVAIGEPYSDTGFTNGGSLRVFELVGGVWIQKGITLNGLLVGDLFGSSVSLNANGNILIVGAPYSDSASLGTNTGYIQVFEFIGGVWTQKGATISGVSGLNNFGFSVDISDNGSIIATGAPGFDFGFGQVRVFEFIGGVWTLKGLAVNGVGSSDGFGLSISLSGDGNTIVAGAPFVSAGVVRVYEFIGNAWTQSGTDINGKTAQDKFGSSVGLSSAANILIVGAPYSAVNGFDSGQTSIYQKQNGNWVQIGVDLNGETSNDRLGTSVGISNDGSIIVVGAPYNSLGGISSAGRVKAYSLVGAILATNKFTINEFNIYPNPVKNQFKISLPAQIKLQQVKIYNNIGQCVSTSKSNIINVSHLNLGLYFVEIYTNKGKGLKKILMK